MSVQDFLVELGTEELPPKALNTLANAFANSISKGLNEAQLNFSNATVYATPRRLAVWITDLQISQNDQIIERRGPALQSSFDDEGKPSKAAEGFARGCGVTVDELEHLETDKGTWLNFKSQQKGKPAEALLPNIVEQSLQNLPIPKRMRWGSSRTEFVRPVHWLIMLLGDNVIDCEILGQHANNVSQGHRFHCDESLVIPSAADYAVILKEKGRVIADFEQREQLIKQLVLTEAEKLGHQAVIDEELLNEVTGLCEWPTAITGQFDSEFLQVPTEALISSMQEHQKYFPVVDNNGIIQANFIAITNIESKQPDQVIKGNEKVIRPRLADAAFFFNTDKKTKLIDRTEQLKTIVFQAKLGSLFEKSERVSKLAGFIAEQIGSDKPLAERAALLSKTDLVTDMVGEFPDLQGIMGQYYAEHDGENADVAKALNEQYMPRFAGDQVPGTLTGAALAIADKMDSLTGLFVIGQPPSGDKDPFALRRAALGCLRIIVEKQLNLDLLTVIQQAVTHFSSLNPKQDLAEEIFDFMLDRLRAWYQDEGISTEVFLSVRARRPSQPLDFHNRIHAVNNFNGLSEAEALAAANKRVSNILSKHDGVINDTVDETLLQENAEINLAKLVTEKTQQVTPLFQKYDYKTALEQLASLKEPVDVFFDEVMVMADDDAIKNNRLALLNQLRNLFLQVADISLL